MSNSASTPDYSRDQFLPVLVATMLTQGRRGDDFHAAIEGELVQFATECDRGDGCGCTRSFTGLVSRKGTTTVMVAHFALPREDYVDQLRDSLRRAGIRDLDDALEEALAAEADELLDVAETWPVGTVLERRGDHVYVRDNHRS